MLSELWVYYASPQDLELKGWDQVLFTLASSLVLDKYWEI